MILTKIQLEQFYRLYDYNPMSVIMSRLMTMTGNDYNKAIDLMEQVEDYITKKDLNENEFIFEFQCINIYNFNNIFRIYDIYNSFCVLFGGNIIKQFYHRSQ